MSHFLELSTYSQRKHQEAREYIQNKLQRVCRAYEQSDIQIVAPFEL